MNHECSHDTSVVAAHVDHVVGFSIFVVFQVSSLDQNVVDLLLGSFRRSVSRLFSKTSFCISCWVLWNFVTSASASASLLFCFLHWVCAGQHSNAQLRILHPNSAFKSPPTICVHFFLEFVWFSIVLYIFRRDGRHTRSGESIRSSAWCVDGWPKSLLWWPVRWCTQYRWFLCRHVLVQHNSNSEFVVVFHCSHEYVFVMCLPIFWLGKASKSRSVTLHPVCNLRARKSCLRFFHLSALMSCFLQHDGEVVSFSFVFPLSLFSFIVFLPHRSLLPPAVLLLLSSFLLLESLRPKTVLFLLSFLLLLVLLSLCSSSKLRILSGTSSSTFRNLSLPPPLPFGSSCSRIFVSLSPLSRLVQSGKSPSACLSLCLPPPFTSTFVVSLVSLCLSADVTTRSLPFIPAFFFVWKQRNEGCQCGWQCGWIRQHESLETKTGTE